MRIAYNNTNNQDFTMSCCTFENNGGTPSLDIQSMLQGIFTGCEFALTTAPGAGTAGVYMAQSGSGLAQAVVFDSTLVRIGAGFTPYTLFTLGANANRCEIRATRWQIFDAGGQVRYSDAGNNLLDTTWAQYQLPIATPNITVANGANQNVALPAEGAAYNISGPTGVFNIGGITQPVGPGQGRIITLANDTGFAMTLNNEDGGSTATNRILLDNSANLVINSHGTVHLMYFNTRWRCIGHG
jgi:hypothetical protein